MIRWRKGETLEVSGGGIDLVEAKNGGTRLNNGVEEEW